MAISGDTVVVGAFGEDGAGTDRGAAYVFERNHNPSIPGPLADNWGQVAKLEASVPENDDRFGILGSHQRRHHRRRGGPGRWLWRDDLGAAYVFERNQGGGDNWGQVTKLVALDSANNDYFGISVAISGDTVVVGAHREDTGFSATTLGRPTSLSATRAG